MNCNGPRIGAVALWTAGVALCTAGVVYACRQTCGKSTPNANKALVEKAGHPDPDDIDDNNMVSEGSQFPVQYYNKR